MIKTAPLPPIPPIPNSKEGMPGQEVPVLSPDAERLIDSTPSFPEYAIDDDYFLTTDGEIIRVKPECYKNLDVLTGVLSENPGALPMIWSEWLKGPDKEAPRTLTLGGARIILATGLKGAGKSLTLAYLGAKALASKITVWSNMAIKFWLIDDSHELRYCGSNPLDWDAFLSLSKELQEGAMVVDELTYFLSSRQSQSVRNRIINAGINQVRKRTLDFYASVKFPRQVDVNLRDEMDCEFACQDLGATGAGQEKGFPKGCFVRWTVRDISGWSGSPTQMSDDSRGTFRNYQEAGKPIYANGGSQRLFKGRPFWPIFNSYEVVDAADAFRKVRLDLQELVVSDKPPQNELEDIMGTIIDEYRQNGYKDVECDAFRATAIGAGVNIEAAQLGKILRNSFGVTRKRRHKSNCYIISEDE